jgi:hypothetical protein
VDALCESDGLIRDVVYSPQAVLIACERASEPGMDQREREHEDRLTSL